MKKSLVLFVISGVLSLSILAPSICTLLEISIETALVIESDDESKKKSEKDLEEKQWDTHKGDQKLLAFSLFQKHNFAMLNTDRGLSANEVTSPPPESRLTL